MSSVRVFGYVAAQANVAVLLAQRSPKETAMIRWNLRNDRLEVGQWLKSPISPRLCDLSPDGALFAFHSSELRPKRGDVGGPLGPYLAVSRPPYFTALAAWQTMENRPSRVQWKEARELWIDSALEKGPLLGAPPSTFSVRSVDAQTFATQLGERFLGRKDRFASAGWDVAQVAYRSYDLNDAAFRTVWADVDHQGRLLLAKDGRIYVRDSNGERELIDLNPFEFRALPPLKWTTEWPD